MHTVCDIWAHCVLNSWTKVPRKMKFETVLWYEYHFLKVFACFMVALRGEGVAWCRPSVSSSCAYPCH